MKRIFIDTNIFLDFIQKRPQGWREAEIIFFLAINGDIELIVSDLTIANMRYITRKDIPLEQFYTVMKRLRSYYRISEVGEKAVDAAFAIEAKDFEDALQYYSAVNANAECIITRNIKDYDFQKTVKVFEPREFLEKYYPQEL